MSSNGNILVLGSAPRSGEAGQRARVPAQNADGASRRGHARQAEPRAGRRAHAKGAVAADHEPVAARSASSNRTASASGAAQAVAADASAADARAAAREEARAKRAAARERAQRGASDERAQRGASDERAGKQGSAKGFSLFAAKGTEKAAADSRAAKGRGSSAASAGEGRSAGASASAKDRAASVAAGGVRGILAWFMDHKRLSIALGVILALAIVVYPPACSLYSAARSNAILSAKLSEATTTADTLQSEVDSLMTREGIEDEARRRGYVSEGETAVDMSGVEDSGSASSDSTVTESTSSSEEDPWYIQALDFVFRYDASTQGIGK